MRTRSHHGFTLIELLTTIAIIAILVAILMPVLARVQEGRRQTTCMSNLHQLYVAANLYKHDHDEYPCMLLGYAEREDGLPWVQGDPAPPVPANRIQHGFLYPAYVKNIEVFLCPNNPVKDQQQVTTAHFPPSSPWNQQLTQQTGNDYPLYGLGFCFEGLPAEFLDKPLLFYAYDSYDISSYLAADGTRVGGNGFQIVYTRDWTASEGTQDAPNQLKYQNPPPDRTILSWCNYHVTNGGHNQCMVIFASGTARKLNYKQMVEKGWNITGP